MNGHLLIDEALQVSDEVAASACAGVHESINELYEALDALEFASIEGFLEGIDQATVKVIEAALFMRELYGLDSRDTIDDEGE